jgi:hypothetical protein
MDSRDWSAWIDLMPPPPHQFHVKGEVLAPNPGYKAELRPKTPQGFNPEILLLEVILTQQEGMWPQVLTWIECRYDKTLSDTSTRYSEVTVFYKDAILTSVKVGEAH